MQVENVSNLRALGLASLTYANANDGKLPPNTKGTSSETASTLGYSLHDGASPRKLLNKGSFNLLGSKGDYDYISPPDVFYGPFAERIARLRQPGTFFKDPSSGLWLIGYLYFFQTEENPIVPGLSNDHLTGEPLSVSLIWEDEQQRIELHEFPYTKVRVTMAYNAEGGWDVTGRELEGVRLNPWWYPHGIYAPANDGSGDPFTIGRVIHSGRSMGTTGWIGGVAVYNRALNEAELQALADLSGEPIAHPDL